MTLGLSGKTALVTGASSGIGRSLAIAAAAAGARVSLVGRSAERLAEVREQIGERAQIIAADLTDPAEVDRVATDATAQLGRIDILLANAGLYVPGDVAEGDPDAWDELLAVSVNNVFRLVNRVLPQMIERRSAATCMCRSRSTAAPG